MSEADRYRWRRKNEFAAEFKVSLATIDRYVRKGKIEKQTRDGFAPWFRWAPDAVEPPQTALTATESVVLPADGYQRILDELEALRRSIAQTQQRHDAARPWWETFRWRKRVSKKSE